MSDEDEGVTITLREPWDDLTFMAPLSEQRAEELVRFVAEGLHGTVLDIGCGWTELLLRVVAAAPAARGVGIDTNEAFIKHGSELAEQRGLLDRVTVPNTPTPAKFRPEPPASELATSTGTGESWAWPTLPCWPCRPRSIGLSADPSRERIPCGDTDGARSAPRKPITGRPIDPRRPAPVNTHAPTGPLPGPTCPGDWYLAFGRTCEAAMRTPHRSASPNANA